MKDREKIIKGFEVCTDVNGNCYDCPYTENGEDPEQCNRQALRDAIALLKEQEAVEPKKVKGYNPPMYTLYEYECEKCKTPIMNKQPFCMGCGRSVKWE